MIEICVVDVINMSPVNTSTIETYEAYHLKLLQCTVPKAFFLHINFYRR